MSIDKQVRDLRALVKAERSGVLGTLSKRIAGWPFGSVAPYALLDSLDPILLVSEIAEHTRNLRADARVSLLVRDSNAADTQAGARATLMGYAIPVSPPYLETARSRYLESFPDSAGYLEVHDFSLFRVKVSQVRYIGGFGEIHWLSGRAVFDSAADRGIDPIAAYAEDICRHMNEDHADALVLLTGALAATEAGRVEMVDVDSRGFDVVAIRDGSHKHLRLDFPAPVETPDETRGVMIDMVRRARNPAGR